MRSPVFCGTISSVPPANCSSDQCRAVVYFQPMDSSSNSYSWTQFFCPSPRTEKPYQRQAKAWARPMITSMILTIPARMIKCSDRTLSMRLLKALCILARRKSRTILMMRKVREALPARATPRTLPSVQRTSIQSLLTMAKSTMAQVVRYCLATLVHRISVVPSGLSTPVRNERGMSAVQKSLAIHATSNVSQLSCISKS
mmetsp:Transcript_37415/g.106881  ORF Transcript_37415/g.106881 Transcript_37415/m.106881 type:complete len:200 (+) Transcript_37415:192-791(+)